MKYVVVSFLSLLTVFGISFADIPFQGDFGLELTKVVKGPCTLSSNVPVSFRYRYNFNVNIGEAHATAFDNLALKLELFPAGNSDGFNYTFLSDTNGQLVQINGKTVTLERVVLTINTQTKIFTTAIQIKRADDQLCIFASPNYQYK